MTAPFRARRPLGSSCQRALAVRCSIAHANASPPLQPFASSADPRGQWLGNRPFGARLGTCDRAAQIFVFGSDIGLIGLDHAQA